jgi:excisionase family DNA binding protein
MNWGRMDDFLTLTQAARVLGVSRWTLYRRIDEGALTVYESPSNRRVKLVKRTDIERLAKPTIAVPVAQSEGDRTDE